MSTNGLKQMDLAVQTANVWLNEIMRDLDVNRPAAWHALQSVLHALRDRLTLDEARHLGAQLPLIIRGLFFDQWGSPQSHQKIHSSSDFLARVKERLLLETLDPRSATLAVFGVLMHHPKGEIQKLLKSFPFLREFLPKEPAMHWPESPFAWE